MGYEPQHFTAPDGTAMIVLTANDYAQLRSLAEEGQDVADARSALARLNAGDGTMPADVLAAILDDGLHPVAAWRRYRAISQAELARRTGLSQVWVSRIENGGGHGTQATRTKLAEALDAPLWALEAEKKEVTISRNAGGSRKYDPLRNHLQSLDAGRVTMSFSEIDTLVGGLPKSASEHDAWWQDNRGESQALAWQPLGFRAEPDRRAKTVTFKRDHNG